jgi:hypothetical protein
VTAARRLLVENLAPHFGSMLFDPSFAAPAANDVLSPRCGLILILEEHWAEETAAATRAPLVYGGDALFGGDQRRQEQVEVPYWSHRKGTCVSTISTRRTLRPRGVCKGRVVGETYR